MHKYRPRWFGALSSLLFITACGGGESTVSQSNQAKSAAYEVQQETKGPKDGQAVLLPDGRLAVVSAYETRVSIQAFGSEGLETVAKVELDAAPVKLVAHSYESGLFVAAQTCEKPHDFSNGELADLCDEGSAVQVFSLDEANEIRGKPERVPLTGDLVTASGNGSVEAVAAGQSIWTRSAGAADWNKTVAEAVDVCFTGARAFGRPIASVASTETVPQPEADQPDTARLQVLDLTNPLKWSEVHLSVSPDSISCGPTGAVVLGGSATSRSMVRVDDRTLREEKLATIPGTATTRSQTLGAGGLVLVSTFIGNKQGGQLIDPATGKAIVIAKDSDLASSDRLRDQALGANYFMRDDGRPVAVGSDNGTWTVAEVKS